MAESKQCGKCNGPMKPGSFKRVGNYGNSEFQWAADGEPPFPVKGQATGRLEVIWYRCEQCGYLELYAVP